MIKLVYCLRRLPELSRGEFQRYWRENHAPLVKMHSQTLRIRRYVQVHTSDDPVSEALRATRPGPEPYDGVAELWYDSAEDMMAGATTAEGSLFAWPEASAGRGRGLRTSIQRRGSREPAPAPRAAIDPRHQWYYHPCVGTRFRHRRLRGARR